MFSEQVRIECEPRAPYAGASILPFPPFLHPDPARPHLCCSGQAGDVLFSLPCPCEGEEKGEGEGQRGGRGGLRL